MKATIIKAMGRYYRIRHDGFEENAVLRGKIRKNRELKKFSSPVAVGDLVEIHQEEDCETAIQDILPRKNIFSRKDRGHNKEDVIAANLDSLLIIQSFGAPDFNLKFVDRLFVRAVKEGIHVVLCMNKIDLALDEEIDYINDYYSKSGLEIVYVSAMSGEGMDVLEKLVPEKRTLFVGTSGVGKTSILNKLFPGVDLRTSHVSDSTGKGRHTTTNVELVLLEDGTELIDTPGMREFGLMDIEPHFLESYFLEFQEYVDDCRFKPCSHDHEPGCAVTEAVDAEELHQDRYQSYINILYSLKDYYNNMY